MIPQYFRYYTKEVSTILGLPLTDILALAKVLHIKKIYGQYVFNYDDLRKMRALWNGTYTIWEIDKKGVVRYPSESEA